MAGLRNAYDVNVETGLAPVIKEQAAADGSGQFGKAWASGRIGNEINPLAIQEADLRAAAEQGDPRAAAQADALRQQITGLQQRQQMYAPNVGRVEDINWSPGRAVDWGLTQMGQGAASMLDPVAASTALSAVGGLAGRSRNPLAQAVSLGAKGLAMGVPAYMSQRQQAGETYQAMTEDPALMARTTATERLHNANISGAVQAIPDTILPTLIGRRLSGAGLTKGISSMPTGAAIGMDLLGEGAGEVFQEYGKQKTLGYMNPSRDTSQDNSDLLNAGLGAMAGASPMSGASHMADAGYRRLGAGAQAGSQLVKDAAGTVTGLYGEHAKDTVDAGVEKAKGWFNRGKAAVEDLTPESVLEGMKSAAQDIGPAEKAKMDDAERAHLSGIPPADALSSKEATTKWFAENDAVRLGMIQKKLEEINDPTAQEFLSHFAAGNGEALMDDASDYILQHADRSSWEDHAANAGQVAGAVGKTIGRVATKAAKGAFSLGKDAAKGFVEGTKQGRKLNAQDNSSTSDDFTLSDWRKLQDGLSAEPLAKGGSYNRSVEFASKAKLAGDYAADMAMRKWGAQSSVPKLARRLAFELADMEAGFKTPSAESPSRAAPVARETRLNRLTGDIRRTYGPQAEEVIDNLGKIMGPGHNDLTSYMQRELAEQNKPEGVRREQQRRTEVAQKLLAVIPDDKAQQLMDQGVNLRSPGAADHLLSTVEKLVSGYHGSSTPAFRKALEQHFGAPAVSAMIGVMNDADAQKQTLGGEVVDDRADTSDRNSEAGMLGVAQDDNGDWSYDAGDAAANSAFVQRRAEKDSKRGRVEDVFGAFKTSGLEVKDPFIKDKGGKRQRLFAKDTMQFNPETKKFDVPALKARLDGMPSKLGLQSKEHVIAPKNALAVMADLGWDDAGKTSAVGDQRTGGALVEAHRDYLTQEAEDAEARAEGGKVTPDEAKALRAQAAAMRKELAQHADAHHDLLNAASTTTPAARRQAVAAARKFFAERHLATASMPGDREITRITVADLQPMLAGSKKALEQARKAGLDAKSHAAQRGEGKPQMETAAKAAAAQALSDANLLHFASTEPGKPPVTIKAGDLVRFVRSRKAEKETGEPKENFSAGAQDEAYLQDLLSGIAILMGSKLVRMNVKDAPGIAAMPYKLNAEGKIERFTKTSVPPSLRLVHRTAGELNAESERGVSEKRHKTVEREQEIFTTAYGADVAARAMKQRDTTAGSYYMQQLKKASEIAEKKGLKDPTRREAGEAEMAEPDWFVADSEAQEVEPTIGKRSTEGSGETFATAPKIETKRRVPRMSEDGPEDPNARKRGAVVRNKNGATGEKDFEQAIGVPYRVGEQPNTSKPKTSSERATPLDFFGEQEEGEVPDDFADQRYFSRNTGPTPYGVSREPRMTAMSGANRRASEVIALAQKDLDEATSAILTRMRSALRPERSDQGTDIVGGPYYVAPLVALLTPDRITASTAKDALPNEVQTKIGNATLLKNLGISPAMIRDMRRVVAEVLLNQDNGMLLKDRVALAKQIAKDPAKITAMSYRGLLEAALDGMGGPLDKGVLVGGQKQSAPTTKAAPAPTAPAAKAATTLRDAVEERQDYVDNPPADYTAEQVQKHVAWAEKQLERVQAEYKRLEEAVDEKIGKMGKKEGVSNEDADRLDELSDLKSDLRRLIKDSKTSIEHDADAQAIDKRDGTNLFGTTDKSTPEVGARLGKSQPPSRGADWSDAGGRKLNAQEKDVPNDRRAKLITRIADARRGAFASAGPDGIHRDTSREVSFGPVKNASSFFLLDQEYSHAFVIPRELVDRAEAKLKEYPADRAADVLSIYAVQHAAYHQDTGEFTSFGPDPRGPAGRLLAQLGALGDTGRSFSNGVPLTRVEGVTDRQLAAFLGDALAYSKQVLGKDKLPVNWVRQTGANEGKAGAGEFNKQDGRGAIGKEATQKEMDEAIAYVRSVLGNDIKIDFEKITGYSGEWIEAENAIKIATTAAAGTMQTTYHEALHAFFSKFVKNNPQAFKVLRTLAEDQNIIDRVAAQLADYPAALQQLRSSGEERLAYIYQFWAAGELDLPTRPATLFGKIRRFFRQVLGRITDHERAGAMLEAFHRGDFGKGPSYAGRAMNDVLMEGTMTRRALKKIDGAVQKVSAFVIPSHQMLLNSDSATARAIAQEFWSNPGDSESNDGEGYLNARRSEAARYTNLFGDAITGLTDRDLKDVARLLQNKTLPTDIPYAPHKDAVVKIRGILRRFYKYMKDERGMDIGNIDGELYFPRVWSVNQLMEKQTEFVSMLTSKYGHILQGGVESSGGKLTQQDVALRIWNAMANRSYDEKIAPSRDDGVLSPFFASKEVREMKWLDNADAEPFLNKDLIGTLTTYFHNGARAAEYTARFGPKGEHLDTSLKKVHNELIQAGEMKMRDGEIKDKDARDKWVSRQMHNVRQAVGAMEGTIGKGEMSSAWRETSAWVTTYQNVRLLPMALFASVVDPLGMVARGATMTEAYETFLRAMKEVLSTWGDLFRDQPKGRKVDEWEKLAMAVGSVDAAMFSHHVSDEYSSAYMGKNAKKVNDFFFKANGMEAMNRGMRVGATRSAVNFIQRHRTLPEVHSARWLKELELDPKKITVDADGNLILDKHDLVAAKGISMQQAEAEIADLYRAINQWVEGAVLTPNAAQRPSWSSDPTWSVFFHLKQFSYSFHQTILKRAVKEMNYGNLAPIGAFAAYIPVMIASDIVKGLIQGGGELPGHMKGMDLGDWVAHGANRAGLLGVGQLGIDAGHDIWSVGGPAAEQIADAFVEPLSKTTLKALPVHGLYAEALK